MDDAGQLRIANRRTHCSSDRCRHVRRVAYDYCRYRWPDAENFLRKVIANDVSALAEYQALYGAALNAHGGILDDLIVYRLPKGFRVVVNASTREKMLDWFDAQSMTNMRIEHKPQIMLAVQGPEAINKLLAAIDLPELSIKPFFAAAHGDWLIARTGYTGEDGVEIMLPVEQGLALWQSLLAVGVKPAGLGARDTLRLEAGLNLYGQDMSEATSPYVSNIGWTVAWEPVERGFIGRHALQAERGAPTQKLTGILLEEKGVLRHDQSVNRRRPGRGHQRHLFTDNAAEYRFGPGASQGR